MCKGGCKGKCGCNITTITKGEKGDKGENGSPSPASSLIVKDASGGIVNSVSELRFIDPSAVVNQFSVGIAQVKFVPAATVWNDVQNLPYYVVGSELFRPQYTTEGNKITFRGLLYVPLSGAPNITVQNSYLNIASSTLDETKMSIVTNANNNNSGPQGRFFTTNIGASPNLPLSATPQQRDVVFTNVPAYRRFESSDFGANKLAIYRTFVQLNLCSINTAFKNNIVFGIGCLAMFSPYAAEYTGLGIAPLGNDPQALSITNTLVEIPALDYINSKDNFPFTIVSAGVSNSFSVNAHEITNLGGFIINLEGLTGYLN